MSPKNKLKKQNSQNKHVFLIAVLSVLLLLIILSWHLNGMVTIESWEGSRNLTSGFIQVSVIYMSYQFSGSNTSNNLGYNCSVCDGMGIFILSTSDTFRSYEEQF